MKGHVGAHVPLWIPSARPTGEQPIGSSLESPRYRFWRSGIDVNNVTDQAVAYLQKLSQDILAQKNN